MRFGKIILASLATLLIAGCKTTVQTEVTLSELLGGETKALPGALYVEVASCNDYQDSRKPSSSLIEAQQQIPGIFKDAEYVECFRQKMDSYAHFKMPIYLDKDKDGKTASNDHINLVSNNSVLLSVVVPDALQKKVEAAKNKPLGSSIDMRVTIKIKNDTGNEFKFNAISAFVDDSPIVYSGITAHKDGEFVVKLSDVSVQAALTVQGAPVLYHAPTGS